MLTALTKKLIKERRLSETEIDAALTHILHAEDSEELHTAAFLVAARAIGVDHTAAFIAVTVANLRAEARSFTPLDARTFVDIVGTGGDGRNTFNVSTTAAIVAAGTGKVRVAKHGGPASTSASGASDLLANLGIDLARVNAETAPQLLASNQFVYLSGPVFHPILAKVKPLRKRLGLPTVFNLVGPLLNPAPVTARVLGVYTPSLGRTYAEAAALLFPNTRALVVCGAEGLDEISPAGDTFVWELEASGRIREYTISPSSFGLRPHPLEAVASGTPARNAEIVYELFEGKRSECDPIRDYVLMNAAALLYVSGEVNDLRAGVELARASIDNGGALRALNAFKQSV